MNITLIIGLIIGFAGILGGFAIEQGNMASLLQASAAMIIFGGTFGIAMIAYPISYIKKIPGALKLIMFHKKHDYGGLIDRLCEIANKARKDGLLSLETEAENVKNPFIKKGLEYIADGVDPEFLKKMLYTEIEAQAKKYEQAAAVFEGMGGTAPTMGVLGTVMGMINVLSHMNTNNSDMTSMVRNIGSAFIATMYGLGSANLLWLPIGTQIKVVTEAESDYMEVIVDGLLAIQAGEPSSRLRDRLLARLEKDAKGTQKASGDDTDSQE